MRFASLYRVSFYIMLVFAALVLSLDVAESPLEPLYPIAVAVAAVVAFLTVDRDPRLGLSRGLANALGLASAVLAYLEFESENGLLLLALGHWLVYLQLIKMFLPKTVEDDWFLFLLGLMQVLVGSVICESDYVGLILFAWALSSLWVLILFSLHREAIRSRTGSAAVLGSTPASDDPYPALVDIPFLFSTLRIAAMTLVLGGFIFLAMPRTSPARRLKASEPVAQHLTGFDEEVKLGQLGEILENDDVVMRIETYDEEKRKRIAPGAEPLWRGVTMATYHQGSWQRQEVYPATFPNPPRGGRGQRRITQQIELQANDSNVLFGLRPILDAKHSPPGSRNAPELNVIDGTIRRPDNRAGSYDYRVVSYRDPSQLQPAELDLDAAKMLQCPRPLAERLRAIAEPLVEGIPAQDVAGRAQALEAYLRNPRQFGYTLQMKVVDKEMDPVLDFLVNRKVGHCEYFASALALLLRSVGIPSRIVNGFKGGDWNELGQVLNVRQKHAHSWVEAYVGRGAGKLPIWITLDPTPAAERNESVASVGGFAGNFRQLTDFVRYIWAFYIVGFNEQRQRELLYDPIRDLVKQAREGLVVLGDVLRSQARKLLFFEDVRAFVSVRGVLVSFTALLGLVGLVRAALWLGRRLVRWYRGADVDPAALPTEVLIYRRLAHLLERHGLERPPTETQREFARRASMYLAGLGSDAEPVTDVPAQVVDAFYRIRFGHLGLESSRLKHLEDRLDTLETGLRATQEK